MNSANPGRKPPPPSVVDATLQGWAQAGRISYFTVSGDSMRPILLPGDVVCITHSVQRLRLGDLLAFRQGSTLIVHRLLRASIDGERVTYQAKGDNLRQPDPLISQEQVVGVVRSFRRGNRELHLQTPVWRLAGQFIATSGIIGLWLDGLGLRIKRCVLGVSPNPVTGFLRQALAWLAALPARIINWLFWKKR